MHDARNAKFLARIGSLGYCCPAHFFHELRDEPTENIARLLGLKPRTIRFWRKRNQHCGFCKY